MKKTKTEIQTPERAAELTKEAATSRNKYGEAFDMVTKSGQAVLVSELKKGQIAALTRKAKEEGYEARALYKTGAVLILPKPAKPVEAKPAARREPKTGAD